MKSLLSPLPLPSPLRSYPYAEGITPPQWARAQPASSSTRYEMTSQGSSSVFTHFPHNTHNLPPRPPLLHPFRLSEEVSSSRHRSPPAQPTPLPCDAHAPARSLVSDVLWFLPPLHHGAASSLGWAAVRETTWAQPSCDPHKPQHQHNQACWGNSDKSLKALPYTMPNSENQKGNEFS